MALNLLSLDSTIRQLMIDEIVADTNRNSLYISPRLSQSGIQDYPNLLKDAVQSHDDIWLASQLAISGRLNPTETRKTKSGITTAKVPYNANEMLAEGEFNRYYLRGLCLAAIQNNKPTLTIYRAKDVTHPRPESEAKIGTTINPQTLLDDLRKNIGVDTALGLPAGPNSGLSAKLS